MAILASPNGNLITGKVMRQTKATVHFLEAGTFSPIRVYMARDPRRVFDTVNEALNWMYADAAEHFKDNLLEKLATDFPDTTQLYSPEVFADWLCDNLGK